MGAVVCALLTDPAWVYRQYDHQLFLNTVVGPGGDAAVLRLGGPGLPATTRGVAITTDSNPRAGALDPRGGTALVLAEAVANLACVGARPAAVVNCLNFGNPEHPEVMWQLSETIDGMSEACLALGLPVIGGNVSLYNESAGVDIDPTPVIGVLGLIEKLAVRPPGVTLVPGASLVLFDGGPGLSSHQPTPPSLGGSRWAKELRGHRDGTLPPLDLAGHAQLLSLVTALVGEGVAGGGQLVAGIHDVSGGGLGVALAEMAVRSGIGLRVAGIPDHHELFTESPSRVLVCTTQVTELVSRAADAGVRFRVLGSTGGDRIIVEGLVDVGVEEATTAWRDRLPSLLDEFEPAVSN
jgi:phosphoribosylformylglycinamidine synthase